jgi:uncharacterized protein YgbK (DUF1537 family)
MQRVLAIADDLTGAAEIAGIGVRYGLPTRLAREPVSEVHDGLTVFDTDSRELSATDVARRLTEFVAGLPRSGFDLVFKKTDSALRGFACAEIEAVMRVMGCAKGMLVPQNPSRGRTIAGGIYRIDGVPIDQTEFAHDPSHPARSAVARELLGAPASSQITIGDGSTLDELRQIAARLTPDTLPAGGADFFQVNLEHRGLRECRSFIERLDGNRQLFACGSASKHSRTLVARARQLGMSVVPMPPDDVADSAQTWASQVHDALTRAPKVLMAIDRPIDNEPGAATRLMGTLANAVKTVMSRVRLDALMVEGGATAASVCNVMGWRRLDVTGELTAGVVALRAGSQQFVIKPGSYRWPDRLLVPADERQGEG